MQSALPIILCAFLIVISVQARSIESGNGNYMSKERSDKYYSKLLTYLKNQQENNSNNDDSLSSSTDDTKQSSKRGFFLFPTRRSSQRYRPIYSYGRKSHWDTFFG